MACRRPDRRASVAKQFGNHETVRKHDSSGRVRTRRASDATDGQNAGNAHLNQRRRSCYARQPRSSAMPPGRPRPLRPETGTTPPAITAIRAARPATAANASSTPAAGRARHRSICSDLDPGPGRHSFRSAPTARTRNPEMISTRQPARDSGFASFTRAPERRSKIKDATEWLPSRPNICTRWSRR